MKEYLKEAIMEETKTRFIEHLKATSLIDKIFINCDISIPIKPPSLPSDKGYKLDYNSLSFDKVNFSKDGTQYTISTGFWLMSCRILNKYHQVISNKPHSSINGAIGKLILDVSFDEDGDPIFTLIEEKFSNNYHIR